MRAAVPVQLAVVPAGAVLGQYVGTGLLGVALPLAVGLGLGTLVLTVSRNAGRAVRVVVPGVAALEATALGLHLLPGVGAGLGDTGDAVAPLAAALVGAVLGGAQGPTARKNRRSGSPSSPQDGPRT